MPNIRIETPAEQRRETESKPKKQPKRPEGCQESKSREKGQGISQKRAKPNGDRSNKKAEVIAMMKRSKRATLAEIVEATGWQKHTPREGKAGNCKAPNQRPISILPVGLTHSDVGGNRPAILTCPPPTFPDSPTQRPEAPS